MRINRLHQILVGSWQTLPIALLVPTHGKIMSPKTHGHGWVWAWAWACAPNVGLWWIYNQTARAIIENTAKSLNLNDSWAATPSRQKGPSRENYFKEIDRNTASLWTNLLHFLLLYTFYGGWRMDKSSSDLGLIVRYNCRSSGNRVAWMLAKFCPQVLKTAKWFEVKHI